LLRVEEASIELARRKRGVPPIDVLHKGFIVFIKAIEEKRGKFLITERLPNGGKNIRHLLHLVVIGGHGGIQFLDFTKLSTDRHRPSH
jgi:hypothetical protein